MIHFSNKTILMANGWDGDVTNTTFLEELSHFMQDQIYSDGIGALWRTATTNIEFEAKVMVDAYYIGKSDKFYRSESVVLRRIEENNITSEDYKTFQTKIRKGKLSHEDYVNMLKLYNAYTPYPEYKDKLESNLLPSLLNSFGIKMFSNKCK